MSFHSYFKCNICSKEFTKTEANGAVSMVGLVFQSTKSGDFTIDNARATHGTHICLPCAKTLRRELSRYDKLFESKQEEI
jgi:hypothetical protein